MVGLYMNPPDNAAVLCIDEKTMIQALDRTQPGLPIKRGNAGTMTPDYKRNGTIDLFAALNVLDGEVVGQCTARHRHQEFVSFLRKLDREFPKSLWMTRRSSCGRYSPTLLTDRSHPRRVVSTDYPSDDCRTKARNFAPKSRSGASEMSSGQERAWRSALFAQRAMVADCSMRNETYRKFT